MKFRVVRAAPRPYSQASEQFLAPRRGTGLADSIDRTMARTLTLLIVMVLGGGPAGSLACELWCTTPAAHGHHEAVGCHDRAVTLRTGEQVASAIVCHDGDDTALFLMEARQTAGVPAVSSASAFVEFNHVSPDGNMTSAGAGISNLRPPVSPALPVVLRI